MGVITERKQDYQFGNLLILLSWSQSQQALDDHICFSNLGKIHAGIYTPIQEVKQISSKF